MMRAYNCNITPGFAPTICAYQNWGTAKNLPVTLNYDPANPSRCQIAFALDETATGGGTCYVQGSGAALLAVPMDVPPTSADGIEWLGQPLELKAGTSPFPQGVVNRGPLPPFPPQPPTYNSQLWFAPPADAQKRYWRCNFGCVTIPGLPWVPGMEDQNFDRVLTGFFGRYDPAWQSTIVTTYRERGYTQFVRWVQDEQSVPGYSIQKYVDECKQLKNGGVPFIAHSFLSKEYAPYNPALDYLRDTFGPLIDALQAAECLDICLPGFELDLVSGGSLFDLIDYFTVERGLTEAADCPSYLHLISAYTWPGVGAPDRRQWWDRQYRKLTGLCYQNDPIWAIATAQDVYQYTTNDPREGFVGTDSGFGHPFDFVPLETRLALAFGDNAIFDENDLDQFGYLSLCTPGDLPGMGFGCGARRPDGVYL